MDEQRRKLISERTREALAARKAAGVRLGRPRSVDPATLARIHELHEGRFTLRDIANILENEGVPTAQGGKRWHAKTVANMLTYDTLPDDENV